MSDVASRVARVVRRDHGAALAAVGDAADAVAADWDGDAARSSDAVVEPLRAALVARGTLDDLVAVLRTAVGATGEALPADPVAAPPYVVVTSRGPLVRGTLPRGRLVLAVEVFAVERDPVRYRRTGDASLAVAFERGEE